MDWTGNDTYLATVDYTCGKFATFIWTDAETGTPVYADSLTATCQWNKTWDIAQLPGCECESYMYYYTYNIGAG